MQRVTSKDGTGIAFDRYGEGPPLILVAGATATKAMERSFAEAISTDFTVFAYDRRGRVDSGDTAPYAVEREIEDVEALIAEAGGSAFVFGHSSGAAQAASEFYEGKLGLTEWTGLEDNRAYECGEGSVLHVYLSPDHAGGTTATLTSWYVEDIEGLVDELTARGVAFERYDEALISTDERGIATFGGGAKVAYFKDPDGNTLSVAQGGDCSCGK